MTNFVPGGPARYQHQKRGLQKAITTGGVFALLYDPGTGKTAIVIDYACLLALKSPMGEARVLVIAPLAAVDTWVLQVQQFASPQVSYWVEALGGSLLDRAEALASRGGNPYRKRLIRKTVTKVSEVDSATREVVEKEVTRLSTPSSARGGHPRAMHWEKSWAWAASSRKPAVTPSEGPDFADRLADGPRLIIEVINLDTLQLRTELGSKTMADQFLDAIKRFGPDLVVVDEAHKIKSAGGNASRLLSRITKHVRRRAILTGTVMPHSPLDVFGQWRFLDPYAFGHKDEHGVLKQAVLGDFHKRFAKMGGFYGKEVRGYSRLDEMQLIMARNAVVARKEECLDLPPTQDVIVPVHLGPAEASTYLQMKATMAVQLASGLTATETSVLTQGMRLRQITSGHLPTDDHGPTEVVGRSKVDVIKSLVEDTLTHEKRIVIFAFFSFEIKMLAATLTRPGTEVMVIEGGTPLEDRRLMRARFGSDDVSRMVMIAQVKTMSVAVNELVTASHAIFASLSQQRDDLIQAKARLDRVGQTRPVTFWLTVAPGTVDEVILKSHQDRTNLEDAMLKHIQQQGFSPSTLGQRPLAGHTEGDSA